MENGWDVIATRVAWSSVWWSLGFVLPSAMILYKFVVVAWQNIKLQRMNGVRSTQVQNPGPFGLAYARRMVLGLMRHKNLELWDELLRSTPGNTAETRLLGRRVLMTTDVENIKAILAAQFGDFGKGEPFHREWHDFLGDSIFTTDGEQWHASRQLIRPQFIRERVSDLDCFETHVHTLFRAIANGGALDGEHQAVDMAAGNGRRLDVSDLFFRYTLDVATEFLLGMDVKSLSTPRQQFADAFAEVQRVQSIISRAGPLHFLVPRRSFWAAMRVVDNLINTYIDRALRLSPSELEARVHKKGGLGYTFLHALAGFTRDRKVLHDQIMAVLLAGRDTTASTLSWTLYELARHPDVVGTLRAEILAVVGPARTPTYDDLKRMKYLSHVLNEVLRLYPSVPFNVRLALRDTTLPRGGGPDGRQPVAVLKDTPIAYSTLLMQRRPDLYPPPDEAAARGLPPPDAFAPDRWSRWQPRPWHYIPFNGGPRICIGQQFALTEMAYVLTRLFQRFDRVVSHMDEVDGGRPTMKADIVLQPGDGVFVSFLEAQNTTKEAPAERAEGGS